MSDKPLHGDETYGLRTATELLKRLRKHPVWTMDKQNVTADAADLIESLQAEVEALRKQEQRTRIAVYEMLNDYRKGDFGLDKLALLDLQAIVATLPPSPDTGEEG